MVREAHADGWVAWQLQHGAPVVVSDGAWFRLRRLGPPSPSGVRVDNVAAMTTERGRFDIDVRLGVAGERPVITGLVITAAEGTQLTSTDLKQLSIPTLVDAVLGQAHEVADLPAIGAERRGPGAPKITGPELEAFARTYREAVKASPRSPTQYIADRTEMSTPTVRRWRARAEAEGLLEREV